MAGLINTYNLVRDITDVKPVNPVDDVRTHTAPPLLDPSVSGESEALRIAQEQARLERERIQREADDARRRWEQEKVRLAKPKKDQKVKEDAVRRDQRRHEADAREMIQRLNELPVPKSSRQLNW